MKSIRVLAFASLLSACSSDPAVATQPPAAGAGGAVGFDNPGVPRTASAGSSSPVRPAVAGTSASSIAAGSGGQASSAGRAGSAGQTSALAAGSGGAAAGTGGAAEGAAGAAGADEDVFGGLFGTDPAAADPAAISCSDLVCFETADCASLHPDENAACKFTSCVDFLCK
jgi:hypothetical protein